ncbi:hypothetical protein [Streptomyces sp. NBC_01716]|uniref:hypothetical protein n=1 Tax=Streptomyces sp. NBC_01716 TaxID=2975917 RepID=UPI002E344BD3|nr:hypothetical protein [Streptomyces sp. NBC_01716]
MPQRELKFPSEQEFIEALGVVPQSENSEDLTFSVTVELGSEKALISWDVLGCSVRFRIHRAEKLVIDLFREGVSEFSLRSDAGKTRLFVRYEVADVAGELSMQVLPEFQVMDAMLLS